MKEKHRKSGRLIRHLSLVLTLCCLITVLPAYAAVGPSTGIKTGVTIDGKLAYADIRLNADSTDFENVTTSSYTGGEATIVPIPSADNPSMMFVPTV